MSGLAQRALLLAAAAAAIFFAVVWIDDARNADRADLYFGYPAASHAQLEGAAAQAHRAQRLTPDRAPRVLEAGLLARLGRHADALRMAQRLVSDEPSNASAWFLVATLTRGRDQARFDDAVARIRALRPLGP